MIQYAGPEDALTLFPAVLFWSRLANRPHADYAAVHFTNLWSPAWGVRNGPRQLSAVYGWWTRERENERRAKERKNRKRRRKRVREVGGGGGRHGGKNKRREWSAVWKYKVGCKDCEFWGFCSFASFSSTLAYEKIHRLNGLVYYFLYPSRPPCESSAKKSATFYPLPLFLQPSVFPAVFLSPPPFILFLKWINRKNAPYVLYVEVFSPCSPGSPVYSHFSLSND